MHRVGGDEQRGVVGLKSERVQHPVQRVATVGSAARHEHADRVERRLALVYGVRGAAEQGQAEPDEYSTRDHQNPTRIPASQVMTKAPYGKAWTARSSPATPKPWLVSHNSPPPTPT